MKRNCSMKAATVKQQRKKLWEIERERDRVNECEIERDERMNWSNEFYCEKFKRLKWSHSKRSFDVSFRFGVHSIRCVATKNNLYLLLGVMGWRLTWVIGQQAIATTATITMKTVTVAVTAGTTSASSRSYQQQQQTTTFEKMPLIVSINSVRWSSHFDARVLFISTYILWNFSVCLLAWICIGGDTAKKAHTSATFLCFFLFKYVFVCVFLCLYYGSINKTAKQKHQLLSLRSQKRVYLMCMVGTLIIMYTE